MILPTSYGSTGPQPLRGRSSPGRGLTESPTYNLSLFAAERGEACPTTERPAVWNGRLAARGDEDGKVDEEEAAPEFCKRYSAAERRIAL